MSAPFSRRPPAPSKQRACRRARAPCPAAGGTRRPARQRRGARDWWLSDWSAGQLREPNPYLSWLAGEAGPTKRRRLSCLRRSPSLAPCVPRSAYKIFRRGSACTSAAACPAAAGCAARGSRCLQAGRGEAGRGARGSAEGEGGGSDSRQAPLQAQQTSPHSKGAAHSPADISLSEARALPAAAAGAACEARISSPARAMPVPGSLSSVAER